MDRKRKLNHGDESYDVVFTEETAIKEIMEWASVIGFFEDTTVFLDPTAGDGRLGKYLPGNMTYLASDIQPQGGTVMQRDYREVERPEGSVCVGFNPPFGYIGRGAKTFIEWVIDMIAPERMLLILPHIAGGWLPDNYAVLSFLEFDNIFRHGHTNKKIRVSVRVYAFVREPGYRHTYDLNDRYLQQDEIAKHPIQIESLSKTSRVEKIERFTLPVLWVKRVGERSGRVFMIDVYGDGEWDLLEPRKEWREVSSTEVGKTMSMTGSWVQVSGMSREWLRQFSAFMLREVRDEDIFCSHSSLSAKQKTGSITVECVRFYLSQFLGKFPHATKDYQPGAKYSRE